MILQILLAESGPIFLDVISAGMNLPATDYFSGVEQDILFTFIFDGNTYYITQAEPQTIYIFNPDEDDGKIWENVEKVRIVVPPEDFLAANAYIIDCKRRALEMNPPEEIKVDKDGTPDCFGTPECDNHSLCNDCPNYPKLKKGE
jgi:hypothetical protein